MAADILHSALPKLDPPIVDYVAGYVETPDSDPAEDVLALVRAILESATLNDPQGSKQIDSTLQQISKLLPESPSSSSNGNLRRVERVVDMGQSDQSKTANFEKTGQIDITHGGVIKASRVDVKKLAKQEAKTKAKIQKRAQRDLYETSKLVENARMQESYEEMFLKVNPMESIGNRSKNKDIHLLNIDVSFGSNVLLNGASLTLAQGRRYGVVSKRLHMRNIAKQNLDWSKRYW